MCIHCPLVTIDQSTESTLNVDRAETVADAESADAMYSRLRLLETLGAGSRRPASSSPI